MSTAQAAEHCGVDRRTVLRWVKSGLIRCWLTGGGQARIQRTELRRFMRERGMPVPAELDGAPRIALIDDQEAVRVALSKVLRRLLPQAQVQTATDGFEAGLLIASMHPDLVLLDIVMPGLDGVEVVRRLRRHPELNATRIVVLSGNVDDEMARELRSLEVEDILQKPLEVSSLANLLGSFGLMPAV